MRNNYPIIYAVVVLIIAFFLLAICFAGGHELHMSNPWMYFYITNFYSGLFISLNCFISKTRIRNWSHFKVYYITIHSIYILITLISIMNFLLHDKISKFDLVIASLIIILTTIAIMTFINRKNEIKTTNR
jgi:hypothetical protein